MSFLNESLTEREKILYAIGSDISSILVSLKSWSAEVSKSLKFIIFNAFSCSFSTTVSKSHRYKLGGNRICTNKIFERYFELALIYKKSDEYIFRSIRKIKTAKKLRNKNSPLSHARTGELLLDALVDIRLKKIDFELNSLPSEGTTLIANKSMNGQNKKIRKTDILR